MPTEISEESLETSRRPKNWRFSVRHAVLNVIGIVRIAMLTGRQALIDNGDAKDARIHQLESEVAMLREELRLNGARMRRVAPHRRPQYTAIERMAILQLRAIRGWNKAETARRFFVTDDTIRVWLLVGLECDRSLFKAIHGMHRVPVSANVRRGDCALGSNHCH
jgi:hypothetical protein